ncbi:hypothetical protein VTO42DRAFT_590 [Malbranchea cinnamomea]
MPGRAGTRAPSTTSTRKSSVPPSTGAPSVFIPEEPPLPTASPHLRPNIIEIFADAQRATTGHRKLVVKLRKIQEYCCGLRVPKEKGKKGRTSLGALGFDDREGVAEKEFNVEISRCLLRVLGVKKAEVAGDRVMKFLGMFLRTATEKDLEIYGHGDPDETQTLPETPTSRLTFHIVSVMIPLLAAKEKTVRYRATQIITQIVNSLDSIDDELYHLIRQGLVKRIRDKESAVRVQAVMGLGRLVGNEDDSEDAGNGDDGSSALLNKLLDVMQHDTSAEVRRTLLLNLPLTPTTLPYLLERARDLDAATRRALYSRLLPSLGDFRHLSLSMREKLLRWGLRDRDENVRKATARLFYERWIEDCAGSRNSRNTDTTDEEQSSNAKKTAVPPNIPALLELLERIDVVNSGMEGGIAHEAMRSFWEGRPDYRDAVVFDDPFWSSLTAESAFMARSFNDFCREEESGKYEDLADEKIPEVTALAYYLHKYTRNLLRRIDHPDEVDGGEEETIELEFIVEQLLHICLTLDYSDEVGRRKMFALLRETLAVSNLPDEVTKLTVEVLRCLCGPDAAGENEFCGVILEAIAEVHDSIVSEDSFVSAQSEVSSESGAMRTNSESATRSESTEDESNSNDSQEQPFDKEKAKAKVLREIMINMKCLHIAQCMLQNVSGNLKDNVHLVTMLNNLVVPAVRSHEAPIRERGLECLGLCCLLDKTLAEENMTLFIHCYSKGHEALQETALRILSDILTTHHSMLLPVATAADGSSVTPPSFQKPLLRVFAKALKTSSPPAIQSVAVIALAKLLLTGTLSPSGPSVPPSIKELNENSIDTLLQALIVSFFHPRTRDNLSLRQALTYFFPVYCHSRVSNAEHMRKITVPAIRAVLAAADDFYSLEAEEDSDGEIDDSVGEKEIKALMSNLTGMLAEWTDERRIVGLGVDPKQPPGTATASLTIKPADSLHLALTRDILQRILGAGISSAAPREERKYLLSLLSKLHIPSPPAAPASRAASRAGSRVPEGVSAADDRASVRSSTPMSTVAAPNQANEQTEVSADGAELLQQVKELLDQAITSNVAADATGRNALVKAKNSVLKLLAAAQIESHNLQYHGRTARGGSLGPSSRRERERDRASPMPHIKEEEEEEEGEGYSRASTTQSSRRSNSPRDEDEDGDDTVIARRRDSDRTETHSVVGTDAGTEDGL